MKRAAVLPLPAFSFRGAKMKPSWKPEGYTSLAPYLIVEGAQRLLDFMKAAFGAEPLRLYDAGDGKLLHGEARVGDTVVMFADANEHYPAIPTNLHLYVPDVDAVMQQAQAAGATVVQEPKEREGDPDRRGGVRDPVGIIWWISTAIKRDGES
jgi:uncharacterized glyoxalase superfamily protein PhnB